MLFVTRSALGIELWSTDGTRSGTSRAVARPEWAATFCFAVRHAEHFVELQVTDGPAANLRARWISDGTPSGTFALATGLAGQSQNDISGRLAEFDGWAWLAPIGSEFAQITDGTPAGTRGVPQPSTTPLAMNGWFGVVRGSLWLRAADHLIRVDAGSQVPRDQGLIGYPTNRDLLGTPRLGGVLLLTQFSAAYPTELVALDPQSITIAPLGPIVTSTRSPQPLVVPGGALFARPDASFGTEPGISDGTPAGTRQLVDLSTQPTPNGDSTIAAFVTVGRATAILGAGTPGTARQIWFTDGTSAGTRLVFTGEHINQWASSASELFYVADHPEGRLLHVTDGTLAGTHVVHSPLPVGASFLILKFSAFAGGVAVAASDGIDRKLYWTDGNTWQQLAVLSGASDIVGLTSFGEEVVARVVDGAWANSALWFVDRNGSARRFATGSLSSTSTAFKPVVMADSVYFGRRSSTSTNDELWRTDGTALGTRLVAPLRDLHRFGRARDRLYLEMSRSYFVSDGTTAGTAELPPFRSGVTFISPAMIPTAGHRLVFPDAYSNLWTCDGSTTGTSRLGDLSCIDHAAVQLDTNRVLFRGWGAGDPTIRTWITDGTVVGTKLVLNDDPWGSGRTNSGVYVSHYSNGLLYLATRDRLAGIEPHVMVIGGSAEPLSSGCGGILRQAELFADLGESPRGGLTLSGRSSVGSSAWLVMSAPPLHPLVFTQAGACVLEVDPRSWVVLGVVGITNGHFAQSYFLPDDPAMYGLQATVQAVIAPTNGRLGVDLTNGVLLTIGS